MEMAASEQQTSISSFFLKRNTIVLSLTYSCAKRKEVCLESALPLSNFAKSPNLCSLLCKTWQSELKGVLCVCEVR